MRKSVWRIRVFVRKGKPPTFTYVDKSDFELLNRHRWWLYDGYAIRSRWIKGGKGKTETVRMHRQILGLEQGDSRLGDHINGNRLDNRRQNLRIVTKAQAAQNRKANATGLSGLRGVSFHKNRKVRPWMAEGSVNGQRYYLGYFDTAKEAGQVAKSFRDKFMQFAVDR